MRVGQQQRLVCQLLVVRSAAATPSACAAAKAEHATISAAPACATGAAAVLPLRIRRQLAGIQLLERVRCWHGVHV